MKKKVVSPFAAIEGRNYLKSKEELHRMEVEAVLSHIWCGCGNSDLAAEAFREVFRMFSKNEHGNYHIKGFMECKFVKKHGEGLTILILYWLNHMDIVSHGGSVYGCWLTPLGIEIMEDFETSPTGLPNES